MEEIGQMMSERDWLDLVGWWPELFEGLTREQIDAVVQSCAASWHEGWEPNYEDVRNSADHAAGRISDEEYLRRGREIARQRRAQGVKGR